MKRLVEIDKEVRKYIDSLYIKMIREIVCYVRDEKSFEKLSKGSQQILRNLGIYYEKTLPPDWK